MPSTGRDAMESKNGPAGSAMGAAIIYFTIFLLLKNYFAIINNIFINILLKFLFIPISIISKSGITGSF